MIFRFPLKVLCQRIATVCLVVFWKSPILSQGLCFLYLMQNSLNGNSSVPTAFVKNNQLQLSNTAGAWDSNTSWSKKEADKQNKTKNLKGELGNDMSKKDLKSSDIFLRIQKATSHLAKEETESKEIL